MLNRKPHIEMNIIKYLICLITISFEVGSSKAYCQNMILNPSFELYDSCPTFYAQMYLVQNWINGYGSQDYYNVCATSNVAGVPNNIFGYQYPASGNAYTGLYVYTNGTSCGGSLDIREYLTYSLTFNLIVGTRYYVSLKVNPAVGQSSSPFKYFVNKIGALFTTYQYPHIVNHAHVYSASIITDTLGWSTISGSFIADSAYSYLSLGNFFDGANTNTAIINGGTAECAYYYFDDICVSTDSATCAAYHIGIPEYSITNRDFKLYPNPTSDKLTIETKIQNAEIVIRDVLGQMVYSAKAIEASSTIDVSMLSKGVYFISLQNGKQTINKKLVKD